MSSPVKFFSPQVILFVQDPGRAAAFYATFGFQENFRTPTQSPVKIEMTLDGFELGLALPEPAAQNHGIDPVTEGHRACVTLWADDIEAAYKLALGAGAIDIRGPHPYLDGKLFVAFVEAPDGHSVQLVQRVSD